MLVPHIDTHGKGDEFQAPLDISEKSFRDRLGANFLPGYLSRLLVHSRARTAFGVLVAALLCSCVVLPGAQGQDSGAPAEAGASAAGRADALYRAGIAA